MGLGPLDDSSEGGKRQGCITAPKKTKNDKMVFDCSISQIITHSVN